MKSKIVALSKNEEFKNLLNQRKLSNKYVTIFFGKLINKDHKKLNISFVTKKKIGNAVKRNFAKRRVKALKNILYSCGKKELDYVLVIKKKLLDIKFKKLSLELEMALDKIKNKTS